MVAVTKSSQLIVEPAVYEDRHHLANLIHFGSHVHRHLDWRPPLDWLGQSPFLIARDDGEIVGALASPPDPPNVAWIRLFATTRGVSAMSVWMQLWAEARLWLQDLANLPKVAAIPLHDWFAKLLKASQFTSDHEVVVLSWNHRERPAAKRSSSLNLRPMLLDDIPGIEMVDSAAFGGVWQNSQSCLEIAFRQSTLATLAEENGRLLGYQISTATQMGGHLARLAVLPEFQGTGVGYALLDDMLKQCERRGLHTVTVNTQSDNRVSLSLYQKAGFKLTGEEYPVFEFNI
jgi:ribosomal protein S18 acetylase RimI-like enzyme